MCETSKAMQKCADKLMAITGEKVQGYVKCEPCFLINGKRVDFDGMSGVMDYVERAERKALG